MRAIRIRYVLTRLLSLLIALVFFGMMGQSCLRHADADAVAWYAEGKSLREQDEPQQAMRLFLRAAHSGTTDEMLLGRVWSNMANICRQAGEHRQAYAVYALSAEHFLASHDDLAYAYALNNMAWEQAVLGHKDSALLLVGRATEVYPLPPLTDKVIETHAAACWFVQEYDSVLCYTAHPDNEYLKMLRAQAYSQIGQRDSAACYARLLLPKVTNPFYLDDIYYILTHDAPDADAEAIRTLSSERADVQKQIEQSHGKLMLAAELLREDINGKRTDGRHLPEIIVLGILGLAVAVLGIVTVRERRRLFIDRQEDEQTRRNDMKLSIRLLSESAELKRELQWQDYSAFCHETDKYFHGLATTLQQQGLGEQDIRICVLVLIGLSHKDIAAILPCSQKSIGKLKDLTAHKLGVSGGQLREHLKTIICEE